MDPQQNSLATNKYGERFQNFLRQAEIGNFTKFLGDGTRAFSEKSIQIALTVAPGLPHKSVKFLVTGRAKKIGTEIAYVKTHKK